ncbi:MAG: antibiotic biosynthesis monooxygenase [Candidatus Acidiferrales bacterium]
MNARAVEFVAKPGKEQLLRSCLRRQIADRLQQQPGFSGVLLLTSHKERRLIRVLSLWETVTQSTENHWESSPSVRNLVAGLIDVCAKVHTYEAILPQSAEAARQDLQVFPDVRTC